MFDPRPGYWRAVGLIGAGGGWVGVGLIGLISLIGLVMGFGMAAAVTFGVKTVKVACDVGVLRYCIVGVTML